MWWDESRCDIYILFLAYMTVLPHCFNPGNENLNLLVRIKFLIKAETFTGPSKVLLVLDRRTDRDYREDC